MEQCTQCRPNEKRTVVRMVDRAQERSLVLPLRQPRLAASTVTVSESGLRRDFYIANAAIIPRCQVS
jgi:hypothetical protein